MCVCGGACGCVVVHVCVCVWWCVCVCGGVCVCVSMCGCGCGWRWCHSRHIDSKSRDDLGTPLTLINYKCWNISR